MNNETPSCIHIPKPLHERLKAEAKTRKCFMQWLIDEALTNMLDAADASRKKQTAKQK